jgi:hypothetical protein
MATPNSADANKGDPNKVSFIMGPDTPYFGGMAKKKKPMILIRPAFMIARVKLVEKYLS